MSEITPLLAVIIAFVWPVLTGISMWKYLRAFRQKKQLDAWIWFFAWAMCITAIEWWVMSLIQIAS